MIKRIVILKVVMYLNIMGNALFNVCRNGFEVYERIFGVLLFYLLKTGTVVNLFFYAKC